MLPGIDYPSFIQRNKDLVDESAYWATQAQLWAQKALNGVGIQPVPLETTELVVGSENDRWTYFVVNNDLATTTFFVVNDAIPGTNFHIRNNGHGIVQVQPLDGCIINSPGTLQLRGHGAVVTLVAVRPRIDGVPASWDLFGDVQPI